MQNFNDFFLLEMSSEKDETHYDNAENLKLNGVTTLTHIK